MSKPLFEEVTKEQRKKYRCLAYERGLIQAVKAVREDHGCYLVDAKEYVESACVIELEQHNENRTRKTGLTEKETKNYIETLPIPIQTYCRLSQAPALLSIMLDVHIFGEVVGYSDKKSETRRDVIKILLHKELIIKTVGGFNTTKKGTAYIERLKAVSRD